MDEGHVGQAAVALLVGLLLGLERERSQRGDERLFAGIRTFPVLSLAGYAAALAGERSSPLVLPALVLGVSAVAVASYLHTAGRHVGATTEVVAIFTPLLGALVGWGMTTTAASLAVLVTVLLALKAPLHRIAGAVSEEEILAVLQFAIVAVVLVPLLPSQAVGPYGAVVPRQVGFVVAILSGVSLVGYLLVRLLGGAAWALAGLVGGLVSSTAVTLSFSGKARSLPDLVRPLGVGVVLASTVLYLRGLVVVGLFDQALAVRVAPPLLGLFALGALLAVSGLRGGAGARTGEGVAVGNPAELGRAAGLALLFACVLVVVRVAQAELGSQGVVAAGLLGGLVDVDSVAVAVARLRQQGLVPLAAAADAVLWATLSNLLLKGALASVVGGRALARQVLPAFAAMALATVILVAAS